MAQGQRSSCQYNDFRKEQDKLAITPEKTILHIFSKFSGATSNCAEKKLSVGTNQAVILISMHAR